MKTLLGRRRANIIILCDSSAGIIRIRFAGRKLQVFLSARRTGSPCMGNDVFVRMSITKVWRVVKRSERGERDELGKPGERGK